MLKQDLALEIMKKIDRCLWDFKKMIRLMKGELGRKIMTIFVELKPKTYSYLIENNSEGKKSKRDKKVCHKKILKHTKIMHM